MTEPGRRAVSYLPGRWTALVTDELCLLGDVHLADPLLAACWDAGSAGGDAAATAVLDVLARPGQGGTSGFVLVARAGAALRLVVAGRAHAEVFAGAQDPVVHRATGEQAWLDVLLDAGLDVRLVAADPTPFERISPLPLTSGIVLASYVFSTVIASSPASAPVSADPGSPPEVAVGWIPPPLAQPSQEYPIQQDRPDEPAPHLSGVFRSLPWRSSIVDPDESAAPAVVPHPVAAEQDAEAVAPPDDAPAEPAPRPPAESPSSSGSAAKPSFGAPGYVPPPFGAEAFGAEAFGAEAFEKAALPAEGYVYPPPPAFGSTPPPPEPPASALVQAVRCPNGHLNPLHIDACRVCGAGFVPQQPVTVERPPLGVLRLPTGEAVPLDRDVLLGRAPFAVDQRSVRLVEVASPANDISRSHVRITLDGWQVFATDLGSTNGTAVTLPGRSAALLRAHDPFALEPGAVLSLADEADVRFDVV